MGLKLLRRSALYLLSAFFLCCIVPDASHAAAPTKNRTVILKSFSLLQAGTTTAVKNFNPIRPGASINLAQYSSSSLSIRANVRQRAAFSVDFRLTSSKGLRVVSKNQSYPYIFRWSMQNGLPAGSYTLTAVPHLKINSRRTRAAAAQTISFSLTAAAATGTGNTGSSGNIPVVPIPLLSQWEQNMISYGHIHCNNLNDASLTFDVHLAATYYDAEWVFYQIGDYTKDSSWYDCAHAAQSYYRDQYVIPNNGVVPGYWNFSHGMTEDFVSTGDPVSQQGVVLL